MNREILFRAKRIDNWGWVEGCLLMDYVSGQYFIHASGNSVNESDKTGEDGCLKFFAYEVSPETICELTGLTDKMGRKIFDGDIISFSHSRIADGEDEHSFMPDYEEYKRNYMVEFINTYYTYGLRARNKSIHFKLSQATINTHNAKVIGNIFDNPELLQSN